jgi:hypothetical protein
MPSLVYGWSVMGVTDTGDRKMLSRDTLWIICIDRKMLWRNIV